MYKEIILDLISNGNTSVAMAVVESQDRQIEKLKDEVLVIRHELSRKSADVYVLCDMVRELSSGLETKAVLELLYGIDGELKSLILDGNGLGAHDRIREFIDCSRREVIEAVDYLISNKS